MVPRQFAAATSALHRTASRVASWPAWASRWSMIRKYPGCRPEVFGESVTAMTTTGKLATGAVTNGTLAFARSGGDIGAAITVAATGAALAGVDIAIADAGRAGVIVKAQAMGVASK